MYLCKFGAGTSYSTDGQEACTVNMGRTSKGHAKLYEQQYVKTEITPLKVHCSSRKRRRSEWTTLHNRKRSKASTMMGECQASFEHLDVCCAGLVLHSSARTAGRNAVRSRSKFRTQTFSLASLSHSHE